MGKLGARDGRGSLFESCHFWGPLEGTIIALLDPKPPRDRGEGHAPVVAVLLAMSKGPRAAKGTPLMPILAHARLAEPKLLISVPKLSA